MEGTVCFVKVLQVIVYWCFVMVNVVDCLLWGSDKWLYEKKKWIKTKAVWQRLTEKLHRNTRVFTDLYTWKESWVKLRDPTKTCVLSKANTEELISVTRPAHWRWSSLTAHPGTEIDPYFCVILFLIGFLMHDPQRKNNNQQGIKLE